MEYKLKHLPTERCCMLASEDKIYDLRREIGLNNLYLVKLYLFLNSDLDVSNEEFYKMVSKLLNIEYSNEYDLEYLEFLNNKKYSFKDIKTNIIIDEDGVLNQLHEIFALPSDIQIDEGKVIDSNEYKKLLLQPYVYHFGNYLEPVKQSDIDFEPESFETIMSTLFECEQNALSIIANFMNGDIKNINPNSFDFLCEKLKEDIKGQNIDALLEHEINDQYESMNSIYLGSSVDEYFDDDELKSEYLNGYKLVKSLFNKQN